MDVPAEMIVCTHLDWVWRDLVAGVDGRWPLRRDRGVHLPEVSDDRTGWWVATAHAARLVTAGVDLQLVACPPGWLAELDVELTGRPIVAAPLRELVVAGGALPRSGFVKPSLAKLAALQAGWYDDVPTALAAAVAAGVAGATPLELTTARLDLAAEFRTFVLDGAVSRPSPYRLDGHGWEPDFDARTGIGLDDAWRFAAEVASDLAAHDLAPRAYVLDVARTAAGAWVVVEANAAWSSGTYGCDLADVADAVAAASTPPADDRWRWRPDPTEHAEARARPLLTPAGRQAAAARA